MRRAGRAAGEHEAAFAALLADLMARLAPEGDARRQAVECAARELWRLRRAGLSETGALAQLANPYLLQAAGDAPAQREVCVLGATLWQDFGEGGYESRSGRALERALRVLKRLRALSAPPKPGEKPQAAAAIGFVPTAAAGPAPAAGRPARRAAGRPEEVAEPRFPAGFGFVPQNRAAPFGSVSALAELTRAPEIRWPPGWKRG